MNRKNIFLNSKPPTTAIEDWDIVEPNPSPVFEALRAFGYTPETAIADLVDNSISAEARNIHIAFVWNEGDAYVVVKDDGVGMSEDKLVGAMRLGSQSPAESRRKGDLGRYGLGMKTASISQAREVTVVTITDVQQNPVARRWDLDEVQATGEWRLRTTLPEQAVDDIDFKSTGTAVIWTKCDRLAGEVSSGLAMTKNQFFQVADSVSKHLAMTFHRFLERPRSLNIVVNGNAILPWDPFLRGNPHTWSPGGEKLGMLDTYITVTPYVLPHKSKLTDSEHKQAGGSGGWNAQQGFYVYRDDRLLMSGSWLGVAGAKEEHTKLARIALDVPASLDHLWQVDVKKSQIRPPASVYKDLARIARSTKAKAQEVYRFRGKISATRVSQPFVFAWLERRDRDQNISYRVNRENPVVQSIRAEFPTKSTAIERLLKFVEETVPLTQISVQLAKSIDSTTAPYSEDTAGLYRLLRFTYDQMLEAGGQQEEVFTILSTSEPFTMHPEMIAVLKEEI